MTYDFEHAVSRKNTCSMKYDDNDFFKRMIPELRLDDDTIRIMLADTDFQCAPAITKALHKVADFGNFGYVTFDAKPEVADAIIHWYQKRFGYAVKPEEIVYAGGAIGAVEQTILAFSEPGDGVILAYPGYDHFSSSTRKLGRRIAGFHFIYDGESNYQMDWEAFERLCADPDNKVFVLCSPQNPLGIVWTPEELARMCSICKEHQVIVVSDEIHSDIVRANVKHTPVLAACEDYSNVIMVGGANKSFNLMGLHCAYSIIPDAKLREQFTKGYKVSPTAFALEALIAAYEESEDWLDQMNLYFDKCLEYAVDFMHKRLKKAKVHMPEGTYILWVDVSGYRNGDVGVAERINIEANVCIGGGKLCDPEKGDDFVRICLTCPLPQLKEALERMANVLEGV